LQEADIVCITANFTLEARPVVEAIAALRRMKKEKLILIGGRDAMARPDYFLRMGADLVAYGDADLALPELLVRIYRGEDLTGLVQGGRLLPAAGRIVLDELPLMRFDFLRRPLTHYCESGGGQFLPSILEKGGIAYFETSRGCFRECNFCTERLTKRSEMSLARFREEVDWYRANGVNTIMLSDDNLLQRLNHAERGERELIEMFEYLHEQQMVWEFPVGIEIGRLMRRNSQEFHERLFDLSTKRRPGKLKHISTSACSPPPPIRARPISPKRCAKGAWNTISRSIPNCGTSIPLWCAGIRSAPPVRRKTASNFWN